MAEPVDPDAIPEASVVPPKRSRISVVWIIPILAAIVAAGVAVQRILAEGPTIRIVFMAAEGIEAGKTFVKYKDVNIGQVSKVELSADFTKVEVTAEIEKHAGQLMVEDAKFWVVRPTITLSGVSGLGTLLSGNYIGFEPGKSQQRATRFTGLEAAPVIIGERGTKFVLEARDLGSVGIGAPVYYRRLAVGEVTGYELAPDGQAVRIDIFVAAPHDRFVVAGTRFWNASGVDVSVSANGVDIRTESLVALLVGGLAFDVPPFGVDTAPAQSGTVFTLYRDRAVAMKAPDPIARRFVLHFNESLRGLAVGAPATFFGLPVGEVASVGLEFDPARASVRRRVEVMFYPERMVALLRGKSEARAATAVMQDPEQSHALIQRLVEQRGMRGQLKSGSLLTGQLYVDFDYHPDAPKAKVDFTLAEPELPTVPSGLVNLEDKITSIVNRIDRIPLDAIGNDLRKAIENLDQTLSGVKKLVKDVDVDLMPGLKADVEGFERTLGAVERAVGAVERAVDNANATLLERDAILQQELSNALQEFSRAARSLRVLTDELERQPSSVIRGKTGPEGGK